MGGGWVLRVPNPLPDLWLGSAMLVSLYVPVVAIVASLMEPCLLTLIGLAQVPCEASMASMDLL